MVCVANNIKITLKKKNKHFEIYSNNSIQIQDYDERKFYIYIIKFRKYKATFICIYWKIAKENKKRIKIKIEKNNKNIYKKLNNLLQYAILTLRKLITNTLQYYIYRYTVDT